MFHNHRTAGRVKVNSAPDHVRSPFLSAVNNRILNELLKNDFFSNHAKSRPEGKTAGSQKASTAPVNKDKVKKFPDLAIFLATFEGQNPVVKA